jgi:hypothetical protein
MEEKNQLDGKLQKVRGAELTGDLCARGAYLQHRIEKV